LFATGIEMDQVGFCRPAKKKIKKAIAETSTVPQSYEGVNFNDN